MRSVPLEVVQEELQRHLRRKELFPIIGSGFTRGCLTKSGEHVPSGNDMKDYMEKYLSERGHSIPPNCSFSQVAKYYERLADDGDFWKYIKNHFIGVTLPPPQKEFLKAGWRFVYTLNLDDAIEQNSVYRTKIKPGQVPRNEALQNMNCVIKLHGDAEEIVATTNPTVILGFDEYVRSLEKNSSLLNKLEGDLKCSNTIFIGCSLSDELDLLSVSQKLKEESSVQKNRYFVMDKEPDPIQRIDLESYGIDTVIVVPEYSVFYEAFNKIIKSSTYTPSEELEDFHNLPCVTANASQNLDYLAHGKYLLDKNKQTVFFPRFFVKRNLIDTILTDMPSVRIQVIHGGRISGKSYLLADILRHISNRDTYYFDSRNRVDVELLTLLLNQQNSVLLFDSNVLSNNALRQLINTDIRELIQKNINIICCINNSDRDVWSLLGYTKQYHHEYMEHIKLYELYSYLRYGRGSELEQLNKILKIDRLIPFERSKSILDNLLYIQKTLRITKALKFDSKLNINSEDFRKIALLILLVQNGKVSTKELVQCQLLPESTSLLNELKIAIAEDHRSLLELTTMDSSSYQIVSNATVWLMEQLRIVSKDSRLRKAIVQAFHLLVQSFLSPNKSFKSVENFVKFDKLNELFPDGKGLIMDIYKDLREMLCESYQYFHQHAKCHLWGITKADYDKDSLMLARNDALIALQMVNELLTPTSSPITHRVAKAHILFTLTIIHAKLCIFENFKSSITIEETFNYFYEASQCRENYEAMQSAKFPRRNQKIDGGLVIRDWINTLIYEEGHIPSNQQLKWKDISSYWQALPRP